MAAPTSARLRSQTFMDGQRGNMADQALTYRDFQIEISNLTSDNKFQVRIMGETPTQQTMRADQTETLDFNADDFAGLISRVERRRATQAEIFHVGAKL